MHITTELTRLGSETCVLFGTHDADTLAASDFLAAAEMVGEIEHWQPVRLSPPLFAMALRACTAVGMEKGEVGQLRLWGKLHPEIKRWDYVAIWDRKAVKAVTESPTPKATAPSYVGQDRTGNLTGQAQLALREVMEAKAVDWTEHTVVTTNRGNQREVIKGIPKEKFRRLWRMNKEALAYAGMMLRPLGPKVGTGEFRVIRGHRKEIIAPRPWEVTVYRSRRNCAILAAAGFERLDFGDEPEGEALPVAADSAEGDIPF